MKAPYKNFDLPTRHLNGQEFYVPPKARDPEEIALRQERPAGTLLAEYVRNGTRAAAYIVKSIRDEDDVAYARGILAPAGVNSDWFGFTRFDGKMRNVRMIPFVAPNPDDGSQPDMRSEAGYNLEDASYIANILVQDIAEQKPKANRVRKILSRRIGNASLMLACSQIELPENPNNTFVAQSLARQACLETLTAARTLGAEIGTPPTMAQLADPDSDLSVHIRRTATPGVYQAFDEATEMFRMPL